MLPFLARQTKRKSQGPDCKGQWEGSMFGKRTLKVLRKKIHANKE